jgi:hypothetical protein
MLFIKTIVNQSDKILIILVLLMSLVYYSNLYKGVKHFPESWLYEKKYLTLFIAVASFYFYGFIVPEINQRYFAQAEKYRSYSGDEPSIIMPEELHNADTINIFALKMAIKNVNAANDLIDNKNEVRRSLRQIGGNDSDLNFLLNMPPDLAARHSEKIYRINQAKKGGFPFIIFSMIWLSGLLVILVRNKKNSGVHIARIFILISTCLILLMYYSEQVVLKYNIFPEFILVNAIICALFTSRFFILVKHKIRDEWNNL